MTTVIRLLLVGSLLVSPVISRDLLPEHWIENIPASDDSVQQCLVFHTKPGLVYRVETSPDLTNWTPGEEIYGLGHEFVSTMREFTPAPPPEEGGSPSPVPPVMATQVSLRLQPASGPAGGTVVSWRSLDDGNPARVLLTQTMSASWQQIPLYWQRKGNHCFFILNWAATTPPPTENSPLGPKDTAMFSQLETSFPEMNSEVDASVARTRNAPPPTPSDPNDRKFWRIHCDWSADTDGDGSPDWMEFEMASGGYGSLVSGVMADAFDADTNGDGIPDGDQVDYDRDGAPDSKDAGKEDPAATFLIGPVPRYALFPITNALPVPLPPDNSLAPQQINDLGMVLYGNGIWQGGVWKPLTLDTATVKFASARAMNDLGMIVGVSSTEDLDPSDKEFRDHFSCWWASPSSLPVFIGTEDGRVRAGTDDQYWSSYDFWVNLLKPGPVLGNDGTFYGPADLLKLDTGNWEHTHHARWSLPIGGSGSPTEVQATPGLRYNLGVDLSWGYNELDHPTPDEVKGIMEAPGSLPTLPFMPLNVSVLPQGRLLAASGASAVDAMVYFNGTWHPSGELASVIDISENGTAIGKNLAGSSAPILINGKWTGIELTAPVAVEAVEPTPPWHDGSAALLDTTPGGWILARRGYGAAYEEHGVMLPIRAEGYYIRSDGTSTTEAAGVDDFSVSSENPGEEVHDRIWIMAPQGAFHKVVKLKAPLNSETPLTLSASDIKFGTQDSTTVSGAVNPLVISAADTVSSGGERPLSVILGSGNDKVISESEPIGLKIMKNRTVNVTVYMVTKKYGDHDTLEPVASDLVPNELEITNHLKDVFRPQVNTVFNVNLVETPLEVKWDDNDSGTFNIGIGSDPPGEEEAILDAIPENPGPYDIRVFIMGNPGGALGSGADAYGLTDRANATCWVLGSKHGKNQNKPYLLDTIGHEIGHVFVGRGHPDSKKEPGPAPLPGTAYSRRLMCSGPNSNGSSRLLVKREWDEAEIWLKNRPRGDN